MFTEGKIKSYNDERGFGFIEIEGEKKDLFFHIKDIPNKQISPKVGERLKFRIVEDQGKLKADNIARLDVVIESKIAQPQKKSLGSAQSSRHSRHKKKTGYGIFVPIVSLIVIVIAAYVLYGKYQRTQLAQQEPMATVVTQPITELNSNPHGFKCDGRIHCSEMNSREEARWFIRNCSGTQMDGNNDGEPCESDTRW